jgi:LPS export ABC transporter protein LptC
MIDSISVKNILYLSTLFIFVQACVVDEADLSRYINSGIENVEEARDVDVVYTDSSYAVFKLKAPLLRRVYEKRAVLEQFPEGIEVTFFDKSQQPRSWLTADFAVRDQSERMITVQKNVVLRNDNGERLDGPELIWDERSKEIYTDRFVRITRADGSIIYSYGFKSNEGFSRYELNAVSGDMHYQEQPESADTVLHPQPVPLRPKPQATPLSPTEKPKRDR